MSHDPQSPSDAADFADDDLCCCEFCGEEIPQEDVSVEAFEISGEVRCRECAEAIFAENGQFGVGA